MTASQNSNLSEVWSLFYKLTKELPSDLKKAGIDKYCYNLYDRALYLNDAYVLLQQQNNIPVKHILLRCAFEIKIKASLYQDDPKASIAESNIELKREYEKYIKIIKTGTSITAQILRELLPFYELTIEIPASDLKRKTIKQQSEKADIGFDYELLYWFTSHYIHSSSLSLMLDEIHDSNRENKIIGALSLLTRDANLIDTAFANTMLWITKYLFESKMSEKTRILFDSIWEKLRVIAGISQGEGVDIGEMKVNFSNGTNLIYKRQQRKESDTSPNIGIANSGD